MTEHDLVIDENTQPSRVQRIIGFKGQPKTSHDHDDSSNNVSTDQIRPKIGTSYKHESPRNGLTQPVKFSSKQVNLQIPNVYLPD